MDILMWIFTILFGIPWFIQMIATGYVKYYFDKNNFDYDPLNLGLLGMTPAVRYYMESDHTDPILKKKLKKYFFIIKIRNLAFLLFLYFTLLTILIIYASGTDDPFVTVIWIFLILLAIVFFIQIIAIWYVQYIFNRHNLLIDPLNEFNIFGLTRTVNFYLDSDTIDVEVKKKLSKYFYIIKIRNIAFLALPVYIVMLAILIIYTSKQH